MIISRVIFVHRSSFFFSFRFTFFECTHNAFLPPPPHFHPFAIFVSQSIRITPGIITSMQYLSCTISNHIHVIMASSWTTTAASSSSPSPSYSKPISLWVWIHSTYERYRYTIPHWTDAHAFSLMRFILLALFRHTIAMWEQRCELSFEMYIYSIQYLFHKIWIYGHIVHTVIVKSYQCVMYSERKLSTSWKLTADTLCMCQPNKGL